MRRLPGTRVTRVVGLALALAVSGCGATADGDAHQASIGVLRVVPSEHHQIFLDELQALGWTAGQNLRILPADPGELHETPDQALDALRSWRRDGLDLAIAYSTPYAQLVAAEPDLRGLFVVNDPVAGGLVTNLDAPEGQLTGLTWSTPADLTLDVASSALGGLGRIGYLHPTGDPAVPGHRDGVLDAARALGIDVVDASFDGPADIPAAVQSLARAEVDAVYLASANATFTALEPLERELGRHALPVIANVPFVEFAVVTLSPDRAELARQLARQVARLLDGTAIEAVPTELPRRFEIAINRTQAQSLGLTIESRILRQADVVR